MQNHFQTIVILSHKSGDVNFSTRWNPDPRARRSASSPSTLPSAEDVSEDVAHELRRRCDLQMRDNPLPLQDFTDRYEGRYRDVQLPPPMRLV
jgi:hypothetical protein